MRFTAVILSTMQSVRYVVIRLMILIHNRLVNVRSIHEYKHKSTLRCPVAGEFYWLCRRV